MRNKIITIFVVFWLVIFNYESCRAMFLNPFFGHDLPKLKFLFPPAGWVMFYTVSDSYGYAEVFGVKDGRAQWIDPHDILTTRPILYDNVHRNALISVLDQQAKPAFCAYLKQKFPYFESFMVTYTNYPSVIKNRYEQQQALMYECR